MYKVTCKIHPIVYIGLTKEPKSRARSHFNDSSNTLLNKFVKVYGSANFIFQILVEDTRSKIEELEELVIAEYKDLTKHRPNLVVCNKLVGSVFTGDSIQRGEAHWNAKFTEQDIRDIRSLYATGHLTQKAIGEIYGCSNKVISKVTCGERWKNVDGPISNNITVNKVANRRKLTDAQVVQMREEVFEEYSTTKTIDIRAISEMYEISKQSARLILFGISYSNLPGPILKKDYYPNYGRQ